MRIIRLAIWGLPALLYALFWLWYTPLSGPLTAEEIDRYLTLAGERSGGLEDLDRIRRFAEEDDGRQFIMVNLLDLVEDPPTLPATGEGAPSTALMGHYMEFMYPELFRRACHPIFAGTSVSDALDLVGIEGADRWETAALMRYRSRRDMLEIAFDPRFTDRHDYKMAALEKTIAFPVAPTLNPGDPRLLLALLFIALAGLADVVFARRR